MAEADCPDGGETNEIKAYERFSSTTSGVTFMSNVTDEEYDLLPLPEVDEDFLDDELLQDDNSREVPRCVSFSRIHHEPVPFTSTRRRCFLPGQKIIVEVVSVETVERSRLLSPNMYVIHVTHGDYKWTIRRRYKHFRQLHELLLLYRARLKIPMPTKDHREKRRKFGQHHQIRPHFPKMPETLVRDTEKRKDQLQQYVQDILRCPQFRNHHETLKFLEVSHLSFVNNLGDKRKEGYVMKRSGGRRIGLGVIQGLVKWMTVWTKRWLIVKDTFVAYIRPSDGVVADVILMDRDFNIKIGKKDTGVTNGLCISNLTRHLSLKCSTPNQMREWERSIDEAASTTGSEFTTPNRFKSFAPEREGSYVSWFQDAASYMSAVADAMEAAREEIFITDWWLSPEVYMKRPHMEGNHWRLDKILERKAEEGVKVFVLLYKEMEAAVGLDSYLTKQALTKLHPNIKVLRHPDGIIKFWSHHEKCVVIDQRVAFLGGVDICFGRWDTPSHRLTDLGSVTHNMPTNNDSTIRVDVRDGSHSSTENIDCNHTNISHDLWMQLQPPTTFSFSLSQALITPMMSVPRAAVSETHLLSLGRMTATVKPAPSDSELVKKCRSPPPGGVAIRHDDVWDMDRNTNQSCRGPTGMDISPQTREVVMSAVQIVIEDVEQSSDVIKQDPSVTVDSHLEVVSGYNRVDNRCSKSHEFTDHRLDAMNNNGDKAPNVGTKVPYIDSDSDIEFKVGKGKRRKDPEKPECDSPSRINAVNGTTCNTKTGDKVPSSSEKETPLNPRVAETLLELFAKVKTRKNSLTETNGDVKADLLNSVSMQDECVSSAQVRKHTQEEQHIVVSYAQSNGKAELNSETYQRQNTSGNADGDSKHTSGRSVPGDYHCISLDLVDGTSGQDATCAASRQTTSDLSRGDELQQSSRLSNGVMNSKEEEEIPQPLMSSAGQRLRPQSLEQRPDLSTTNADQTLEPDHSSTEQMLAPNHSSTELKSAPDKSSTEQTLEPDHSSTREAIKPHHTNTEHTTNLSVSTSSINRSVSQPAPVERDHLTIDPPDLSFSMLKSTLEPPGQVRLRTHSGSWSRDRRSSLTTLSCFIRDGEPLLLYNYLEGVADMSVTDGADGGDSEDMEPTPEVSAAPEEPRILVENPGNKKGFWRLKGRGLSLNIKEAVSRAQAFEETPPPEYGIPCLSPTLATPKPSTPLPTRKPTFFQTARMVQHIKGKFLKSPKPDESSCDVRGLIDNRSLFNEPMEPASPGTALQEMGLEGDTKLWIGKDYANFIQKDFVDLDKPFTDIIDRHTTPRMPWHDIGAVVYGKAARDVGRHFIQRWNFTKIQKRKTSSDYPMLLPKSYRRVTLPEQITRDAYCCDCQILRSASKWSAGISHIEDSIQQAYLHLIRNAKHFIYIENQFFISTCDDHKEENGIAEALYKRIIKAHRDHEVFRVYVVMPLLPAFEGEVGTSSGAAIQVVMHWNYMSISRGGKSLLERLAAEITDPFEYISFYGLRTHSELGGNLTTELIYVHSKLMIVDDTKVIIGSANINDRSLIGKRDSELAIVVEDTKMVPSCMNGQSCMVGQYASSLRKSLFREHLGLASRKSSIDVSDPVLSGFYKGVWMKQATINTSMYDKVFNCIPSDKIHNFHELRHQQKIEPLHKTCPTEARRLLTKVKGHLVLLPLRFLYREHLQPAIGFGTKEALVPTMIWT